MMPDWLRSPRFLLASSVVATMLCLTIAVGIARAA